MANAHPEEDEYKPSAVEIQQQYYEAIGGVDWELYEKADRKYLLQKIAVALYGPPTKEGNLEEDNTKKGTELKLQGYELRDEEGIMNVFNKICEQAKYSHDYEKIYLQILRVVCVVPKKEVAFYEITPNDYWVNLHNKSGNVVHTYCFHVFCIRRCVPTKPNGNIFDSPRVTKDKFSVRGCRLYIDHDARIYQTWDAYLTENTLIKSVMVVPKHGQYRGTFANIDLNEDMPLVQLSIVPSPALGLGAQVLAVTDTLSTVANVGALAGIGVALAAPVVAPVALGTALGIGIVTGTYGIVRASASLVDRSRHEQSIGLDNSESRSYWINILVSTAGISCSAATKLLAWAAASGTNVKILMNAVQILQYTNLGTGAIGAINSLGEMIHKFNKYNETPTKLEVFQFTTSVLFLGIGVMSNQTAKEIVQDAQANKINEVRDSLSSNNKRKMFDKVTAETRRVHGTINGNAEVISALKKIDNKEEFFGKLRGMNKQLNKNQLRISLSADGNPLINNQHNIGVADLQALGKGGREQLFSKYGPAEVNSKNAPTRVFASNTSANSSTIQNNSVLKIRPEEITKITTFLVGLSKIDEEYIAKLLSDFSAFIYDAFFLLCVEVISSLLPNEIGQLLGIDDHYKVRIVFFVFDYIKSNIDVDESDMNISFLNVLKRYIRDGRISKQIILQIKMTLFDRVSNRRPLFEDPRVFDLMHAYDKRHTSKFLILQPGEIIKIGSHDILIKNNTTDKLEEWLQLFPFNQVQIDLLLNICFEIISLLTSREIHKLQNINLDDDAVKVVVYVLIFHTEGIVNILIDDFMGTDFIADVANSLKENLMNWCDRQRLRKHKVCEICRSRLYI